MIFAETRNLKSVCADHPMVRMLNQAVGPSIERGDLPVMHVFRHLLRVERFPSGNSRHQGFFPAP